MLEYLFFNNSVAQQFRDYLVSLGMAYQDSVEPIQNAILVSVDEPEDDDLWDEIDTRYDELSNEDQLLVEASEEGDASNRAGIYLQLDDGQQTIAKVDPALLNRILTVLTMEELNLFLDSIVKSVEKPDASPICKTTGPD